MNDSYEPELDFDRLRDWCAFCDGSRAFTKSFPPALYDNLVRVCGDAEPDRDVLPWVHRDLDEKRKLLASAPEARRAVEVIGGRRFAFTHDHGALLDIAAASATQPALYDAECDFVVERCGGDARVSALHEVLYHIATNYFVADSILAPLLKTDIYLGHYFEVYLRGGDYVLDAGRIVVYTQLP
jgi:hypothetical protein